MGRLLSGIFCRLGRHHAGKWWTLLMNARRRRLCFLLLCGPCVPPSRLKNPSIIQRLQLGQEELPVLADQFAVEMDLPAAVVGALNADEVPVNLALVAVVGAAFV